jgi:hypothetical protein
MYIHVEAPDECGHRGETENKVKSIELIDRDIVGPLCRGLEEKGEAYTMLVMPDHPTPISTKTHARDEVPFMIYNSCKKEDGVETFTEDNATEKGLYVGLEQAKAGNRITDISHAIQTYVESNGYSIPRDYCGHGIGQEVHEDPNVPNCGAPGRGPLLKKGMTIAVEPMVQQGVKETKVLSDDWTVVSLDGKLSAHYEHTVLITENGYEILSKL